MSQAKTALAGLARAASGTVVALAEMSTADILAGMTDDQRAEIGASLGAAPAPAAAGDPPADEPDGDKDEHCAKCKEPMKDGKCSACASAEAAHEGTPAYAAGFAAATARAVAVIGADTKAAMLLGNAKLSADEITALLADAPAPASAEAIDPDAAARAEMRAAIDETGNSQVDAASGAAASSATANVQSIWDKAIAANNPGFKRA